MVKCPECGSDMKKMYPDLKGIENYEFSRTFICDNCKHIKQLEPMEIIREGISKLGVDKTKSLLKKAKDELRRKKYD